MVRELELENKLQQRFQTFFPKKRLLAVHLNGFSHCVFFDNGKSKDEIEFESFSGCMPEGRWSYEATMLFAGIGHINYQNAPLEIIFVEREKR